ncbi:MAG: hypothetical protein AB7P07_05825 [Hyphomonadaceae bacterium]
MRLRAQIIIDIDAADFAAAAAHQERVEDIMGSVKRAYPEALLQFRQRRERTRRAADLTRPQHYTGRMAAYEE